MPVVLTRLGTTEPSTPGLAAPTVKGPGLDVEYKGNYTSAFSEQNVELLDTSHAREAVVMTRTSNFATLTNVILSFYKSDSNSTKIGSAMLTKTITGQREHLGRSDQWNRACSEPDRKPRFDNRVC
jgi:hypothetical protein